MKIKSINLLLAGWIVLLVTGNVIWLALDKNPPAWDQAAHIRSVVLTGRWMKGEGDGFIELIRNFWAYPPLMYFIGGLWSLVSGYGVMGITLINSAMLGLLLWGTYRLGEVLKDRWWGLAAMVLLSFFPVIYDISRNFLLDLPLMAAVMWGVYFFVKSRDFTDWRWVAAWWGCLVAASLIKLNGFIYFGPMVLVVVYRSFLENKAKAMRNLLLAGLAYVLAVGWWWVVDFTNIKLYLTGLAGQGEALTDPTNLGDWVTWIHYFRLFMQHQVGPILGLAIVWGVTGFNRSEVGDKNKKLLWLLVVMNYVVFTVVRNKDFRFTLPLLPLVAIMAVLGAGVILKGKLVRLIVGSLVAIWLIFNYINTSFNWPIKKNYVVGSKTFLLGEIEWVGIDDYPVRGYKREIWPTERLVKDLYLGGKEGEKRINMLSLLNVAELNTNNIRMYREMMLKDGEKYFEVHSVAEWTEYKSEEEIRDFLKRFDLVLVPEEGMELAPFYAANLGGLNEIRDYILGHKNEYREEAVYELPSGKNVYMLSGFKDNTFVE